MKRARPGGAAALVLSLVATLLLSGLGAGGAGAAERPWWEPVQRPAPDSEINVSGEPFTGTDSNGDVRGFVDTHNHLMTNEAFGGKLVCGKPFSDKGVADALKDCPEHYPDGSGALLENLTVDPDGHHDPVGWPTFKDWPSSTTMSHQQNYYAWLERAWRAGQRVLTTDLTSNGVICSIYVRDRGCDEMDSIRLQAKKVNEMEAYIDKMYGGEGKGWFRIVRSPEQAKEVVKAGKMAVVLGVETSEPFGCKQVLDVAQCSKSDIDAGLDELQELGVSSMFLCHKFDNALCGVRFDEGTQGTIINIGQFLSTGTFWKTEKCAGREHDNPIGSAKVPEAEAKLPPGTKVPSYDDDARCNTRGLTGLGKYALNGMMDRGMMAEVDHMSVKAAGQAMDVMESVRYPGLISSHSWMDRNWTERLYRMGGFAGSYDLDSKAFVEEAGATADLREKYGVGLGYGTDFNGLGSHPAPRGGDAPDKVTYPFRSYPDGPLVDRQRSGERVWDVNTDGGAHAGLIPDWVEDVRKLGGDHLVDELLSGAQSYLDTWNATKAWDRPENLAKGGSASASSSESSILTSYKPGRALDGDPATRWASDWSDDQWWSVDLGSARSVGRVVLDWESAHASAYRVEVSDDNRTWRTVSQTTSGRGGVETSRFEPTTARYVRVHGTERATRYGYSLREVAVHAR